MRDSGAQILGYALTPGLLGAVVVALGVGVLLVMRRLRRREASVRRTLTMITRCNEAVLRATTPEELFQDVCKVVVEAGGYRMCWAGVAENDERGTIRPVARAGHDEGYVDQIDAVWADEPRGRGPTGVAVRERRIVVGRDFAREPILSPWTEEALRRGYRSATALPLIHDGHVQGVIVMYASNVTAFRPEELQSLTQMGNDVAFGLAALGQRARFQALVEHSSDVTLVIDTRGAITFAGPSAERVLGLPAQEIVGRQATDFIHPEDQARSRESLQALLDRRETSQRLDLRVRRPDGSWASMEAVRSAALDNPAIRGIVVNSRDITQRREAERLLREREQYLDLILTTALDGFWVVDGEGRILDVNPAYCAMVGYGRDEILRMRISDLEAEETPEETAARIERIRERGFDTFETRHRCKDGTMIRVAARVRFLGRDRGVMVCFFHDVTQVSEATAELRESERWLRLSQAIAHIGHYVFDIGKDHWSSSAALNGIFGIDDCYPRGATDWLRVVHPEDRDSMGAYLGRLVETGTRFDREYRVVDQRSGVVRWVQGLGELERDARGRPVRLVGTIQDITERKLAEEGRTRLQAELAATSRLAAMGTLVAGVAHEINNPLTSLTASAGMVQEDLLRLHEDARQGSRVEPEDLARRTGEALEMLVDVTSSADRITRIVKDLTLLGRPDQSRKRLQLADVVRAAMEWLPVTIGYRVTIRAELEPVPDVMASAAQMEQVLVNLVTNASLSMPDWRKGEVVVRLRPGAPGRVCLEVSDDGPGIPPELQERIFEPFFTTRPQGKGTGLGLSICSAIVGAHHGELGVTSVVGNGTIFRVDLPAATALPA